MITEELKAELLTNMADTTNEFKRIFHGRGGVYEGLRHLTIDSIDTIISAAFYFQEENEDAIIQMLSSLINESKYNTFIVQRRYLQGSPTEVLFGELKSDLVAIENGMKFKLNLLSNQNSLYFADMKNGRAFVRENAKDKNVLNLFSYTCAFSVAAKLGGAASVTNVDMSKSALSIGKANHHLNSVDAKGVSFLPYNILKSFSGIKKNGPYDFIIIDPPSFQKGSFDVKKDYAKIIKKLPELSTPECIVLACLNAPELDSNFLIELFSIYAPEFYFEKRVANVSEFKNLDEEKSLKAMFFKRK
ncbi:MAG: rRNA (cytosine1962-C5)-methyltransferase [Campylobacterota bacterium]|nr:rRNA (cytosine1962-C5)-methyltransferase [Campylobacterota bacterium]